MEIDLVCKHGVSETARTYYYCGGKWEHTESRFGVGCELCEREGEGNVLCCPNCETPFGELTEENILEYYNKHVDIVAATTCPKCGSPFVLSPK